ncbi:MAG: hypothetical protein IFNCLDLE_02702 [Ignavibacteriaceae bacterium]|nr:hypothetical protein [Ignavibacteriaceae bacterium]
MAKYYRVTKDTFLWKEGAILKLQANGGDMGYEPIEDIWDTTPNNGREYISARIVEHPNNSEWFERVYQDTIKEGFFRTAEQLKEAYKKSFKK